MGALNNVDEHTGDGKLSMSFCDSFNWSDLDGGVEQVSRSFGSDLTTISLYRYIWLAAVFIYAFTISQNILYL